MAAVFLAAYGLVSLSLTNAKDDTTELKLWWLTLGVPSAVAMFALILHGCDSFMRAIEVVVVLRFPLWVQHTRFKVFTLDTFYETMVFGVGIAVAAHYFAVRLSASTWRCMKAREERRASSVAKTEGSSYRVDDASVERVSRSSA